MQPMGERFAFDQRHRKERLTRCFTDLEDRHDAFVAELRGGDRLRLEPRAVLWRRELSADDRLQRNLSAKATMPRFVNDSHSATADFFDDFILADAKRAVFDVWRGARPCCVSGARARILLCCCRPRPLLGASVETDEPIHPIVVGKEFRKLWRNVAVLLKQC